MKPDKGQGIVLINRDGYNNSLENLFNDTSKFQLLDYDRTIPNLSTVQSYLTLASPMREGGGGGAHCARGVSPQTAED